MFDQNPLGLAFLIILIGGLFYLIVYFAGKAAPAVRVEGQPTALSGEPMLPEHSDAVMLVEAGGRVKNMNIRARQIFKLQDGEPPNLERLARKVRPAESLIKLCASEGQARFVLDGRLVEGTSYQIAANGHSAIVLTLRYPEISGGLSGGQGGLSTQTLQTFTQLTEAMATSLDLDETLRAILETVEKLMPADFMEVTVWDAVGEVFLPYRFIGLPGVDRKLELAGERYRPDQGFTGLLAAGRKALLIPDIDARDDLRPEAEIMPVPMRSYLGLPLSAGSELIGTLELGSMAVDAFREDDLDLVRLLSGQAAIAIHNALLYRAEQQRTAELTGLARLAQAFSSTRDPDALFARLIESIVPLIDVEIIGFLIYNEAHRILEARSPFHGIPDPVVALYSAPVPLNSPAETMLLEQDVLITEDASHDEVWAQFGLDYLAQAASLRETVLMPLTAGGHMLGYLQASNHKNGPAPFTQAELHLLMIVANQAASIVENASLVQQSRQRAQRSEALRRITSLASSAATLDEIFQYSLQELARLLRADACAIFLVDKERGVLKLHNSSLFGSLPELPHLSAVIPMDDAQFPFTVSGGQRPLTIGRISDGERALIPYYQSILAAWKIESVTAVPLIVRNEGIGELWLGSKTANFFDQSDLQVAVTAAGQLAGVAEQSFLRGQTDESLRRRVEQLTAITRISRELSISLDLNYLLNLVYDEALRTTRADCGTILLFDLERSRAGSPHVRFFVGDMPPVDLTAFERRVIESDSPCLVHDFTRSDDQPPHAGVQSALVVPISQQHRVAGLISLHGKTVGQFDDTAVEISQSLAVQAAVVLSNALAYEEQTRHAALLKREVETLSRLIQVSRLIKPLQSLQEALQAIASAIQSATPFQAVVISICDPETQVLKREAEAGLPEGLWMEMKARQQPWKGIQLLLRSEYKVGEAYYIPHNRTPAIPAEVHVVSVLSALGPHGEDAWHEDDLLLIPLYDSSQRPLGLISVDAPSDNRRPDRPTYEALEVFAAQASILVERYQRAESLEHQLAAVEREKLRLEQSAAQVQSNLPLVLHKELEQGIALRGINQRINRIRASLEIAALANRQQSEREVLSTMASEMLTRFAMRAALIAERTSAGIRLLDVIGSFPAGANLEALFGQRNPLRHMLQQEGGHFTESSLVLISNLETAPEWQNNTLLNVLEARSAICLPIEMGRGRAMGILVVGQRALPAFIDEDRRVFAQLAYQVGIGLRNLQLLNETRRRLHEVDLLLDFSRKLGSLSPADIMSVLLQSLVQVLPNAHSGWAGVWEDKEFAIVPQVAAGYASIPDILAISYGPQARSGEIIDSHVVLPLRVYRTGRAERIDELNFAEQYHLGAEDLLHFRKATGGRLPISAMVIPLRIGENVLGVVFFENYDTPGAFTEEDEALASSFTRQAAMALENARLYQASERRASQLQALTTVAGTITSSLSSEELVSSLLDQLKLVLPYDTATLWLRAGSDLTVSAAAGFADNDTRLNITVAVADSALFKTMIQTGQPILVGDLRNDPRFPMLLEPEYLSWLGIPLISKSEVIGLIALEKREPDFYSPDYVQAATAFASQAAVSLENARLFEESTSRATELNERSQRLALLNRLSGELAASLDMDDITRLAGQQLLAALGASGVAAVMIDSDQGYIVPFEIPAREDGTALSLPTAPIFEHLQESGGIFQTSNAPTETALEGVWEEYLSARGVQSLLVVPLISGPAIQGWFMIYRQEAHRYTPAEIDLARTMCNQAAIAIQNARLFAETRRLTEDLERRVRERTQALSREHHNSQTLLHIITELSTSLDMGLVLNRTLGVLNESVGCEESLIILSGSNQVQYRAGMTLAQSADRAGSVERQIARWVIRSRMPMLIDRVQDDTRWEPPTQSEVAYQSVMAVPLILGEEVLGALLLFHRGARFFDRNQLGMMEATARQIGIALNNAELFNLIRDQSEHLGSMLRDQQIEASRSRAILEAVADGVLVTDTAGRVTLFNVSAERILRISAAQALGKSFESFPGLFPNTGDWMRTIQSWSKNPSDCDRVETYAEQLELDNGCIAAVSLAPVYWRQEFLGTVSIFRDITHEVQVDRLKSEFVANVSHELRTPMTSIKGYVEVMLMGAAGELTEQQAHFLKIVRSNTERLGVLVNDLLDISRIEAGRISLNFQPLDVREICADVIADIQRRAAEENRSMTFELKAENGLPYAQGDQERIRQVIGSLVTNGYNYTPDGGCVTVGISMDESAIRFDIHDTGIGIEPTDAHRIFERFYRGEDPLVLATAGTGLGLAIAKTLIDMHHGRIWFESSGKRGEGSTFSFTLPVYDGDE